MQHKSWHRSLGFLRVAASSNPVTNQVFAQTLAKTLHRPAFLPAPARVLKLLLGEMSELLLGSQRVIPRRMLGADYQFKFTELGAALRQVLCD